jgi:two-component system cell cycle response regulator
MNEDAVRRALDGGAAAYVPKADLVQLPGVVRVALADGKAAARRASDRTGPRADGGDSADYLLQRQAVLERALRADTSRLSSLLSRTPPAPAALIAIESGTTRERYIKLLGTTDIEVDLAQDGSDALRRLAERTHAVLFTDRLDLIRETRQLNAGSAIHIIFIHPGEDQDPTAGLRAGANDVMPEEGRGEQFWVHLGNARRIVSFAHSLQSAITDNRLLSTIDELTHVGTRRYFEHQWPREVARAVRFQRPLSLVMCDIDHFKAINDQHGHMAGDEVLREFGDRLTQGLRLGEDWVARIGGEEFGIVLPETGRFQAQAIAERLRQTVSARPMSSGDLRLTVTASFGFCSLEEAYPRTPELKERMVVAADGALYKSKRSGRNRVSEVLLQLTGD